MDLIIVSSILTILPLGGWTMPSLLTHFGITMFITHSKTSNKKKLYIDGNLVKTVNGSATYTQTSNVDMWIGWGVYLSGGLYFDGRIDEFRIYNREIDTSEITLLQYIHDGDTLADYFSSDTCLFVDTVTYNDTI